MPKKKQKPLGSGKVVSSNRSGSVALRAPSTPDGIVKNYRCPCCGGKGECIK